MAVWRITICHGSYPNEIQSHIKVGKCKNTQDVLMICCSIWQNKIFPLVRLPWRWGFQLSKIIRWTCASWVLQEHKRLITLAPGGGPQRCLTTSFWCFLTLSCQSRRAPIRGHRRHPRTATGYNHFVTWYQPVYHIHFGQIRLAIYVYPNRDLR